VCAIDALLGLAIARDHFGIANWAIDSNVLTLATSEGVVGGCSLRASEASFAMANGGGARDNGWLRTSKSTLRVADGRRTRRLNNWLRSIVADVGQGRISAVPVVELMSGKTTSTKGTATDGSVAAVVVLFTAGGLVVGAGSADRAVNTNAVIGVSSLESLACWVTRRRILVQEVLALVA
jgi:hypothetical protein